MTRRLVRAHGPEAAAGGPPAVRLRCGILRHGFARFRCDDCAQSRLVALSCKQRAFCPRCVGRKMADQAKHLVEQVLPPVPYRQWVHALYTDGSFYERSDGQVVFLPTGPPTVPELERLASCIKQQVMALLEKLGLGSDDEDPDQLTLDVGEEDGFDLDAHVSVAACAREELERLVRYILRPPLKETRLTLRPGEVDLTLKTPWSDGTTQIRMPTDRFIDRLAAIVPRPRANTLLYGGLFAANARLRPVVVAYRRPGVVARKRTRPATHSKPRNTPWAELMRHSFGLDVLACPHCGGRMRHVATVLQPASIRRILTHEGLDTPEPRARSSPLDTDLRYEPDEQALAELPEDDFSQVDTSDTW